MKVCDSQAYRKMNVTRERVSRILELREILLSFQTGFNLVNAAVVYAILEHVMATVHDGKTLLVQRRGGLTSHKHVTQRSQGFSTHGSFGDMAAVMKTQVHDLDCGATLPAGIKVFSTVTLTIGPQAVSFIEQELFQLGQLHLTSVDAALQVRLMWQL